MATIPELFRSKKPRRSKRLESKEEVQQREVIVKNSYLGFFELLPTEMKFQIMSYLDVPSLSQMAVSSRSIGGMVEQYMGTMFAENRLFPLVCVHKELPPTKQGDALQQSYELGLYKKRATFLYTSRERINMVLQLMSEYLCLENKCQLVNCSAMMCFGKFLSVYVVGWAIQDRIRLFDSITSFSKATKLITPVCISAPGSRPTEEMQIRLFFRRIFINQSDTRIERTFWLKLLLRPLALVHQARMLLILFAPMHDQQLRWRDSCEVVPLTKQQAFHRYSDLAHTLRLLHMNQKDWSSDDVISIFEEMINIPSGWLVENVACILYFCGPEITLQIFTSRAINGRIVELATLIVYYCSVSIRIEHNVRTVLHLLSDICPVFSNARDRQQLLFAVADTFREAILDIHEYGDANSMMELQSMSMAQAEFCKEVLRLAFEKTLYVPQLPSLAALSI